MINVCVGLGAEIVVPFVAKIGRKRTLLAFSAVFIVGAVRFFFLFKKVMFVLCD